MSKIYLTKSGYDNYLRHIEDLLESLQKNSAEKSESYNVAVGDGWHDNFAFEDAKIKELIIIRDIEKKKMNKKNIEIVKERNLGPDFVNINDIVELQFIADGEIDKFKLTGNYFSEHHDDYQEVTLNSPIGKAIYKKKIGSTIFYKSPSDEKINILIKNKISYNDI